MQEQNPYETPKADLGRGNDEDDHELAGRGNRLGAYLIDSVIVIIVSVPLLFAIGYIEYMEQGVQPLIILRQIASSRGSRSGRCCDGGCGSSRRICPMTAPM